jgi:hypothetical protein
MALVEKSSRLLERPAPAVAVKLIARTMIAILVVLAILAIAASSPAPLDPDAMALIGP